MSESKKPKHSKKQLIKEYIRLANELGSLPSMSAWKNAGNSRHIARYYFGCYSALREEVLTGHSHLLKILDIDMVGHKSFRQVHESIKGKRKFVITAAVAGAQLHKTYFKCLKNYCKKNNAELLIIPLLENLKNKGFPSELRGERFVTEDLKIAPSLVVSALPISPRQMDPVAGLPRLNVSDKSSLIVGSPKPRMLPVATTSYYPRVLMSTFGVITLPYYTNRSMAQRKQSALGEMDHYIGALLVEIDEDYDFFTRPLMANSIGKITDMGKTYGPSAVTKTKTEAVIWGDLHIGDTDPHVQDAFVQLTKQLSPKELFLHDTFNGHSVSHHISKNAVTIAKECDKGRGYLLGELADWATSMATIKKIFPKTIVNDVSSNHNDWLTQWLASGKFLFDRDLSSLGHDLFAAVRKGRDPLEFYYNDLSQGTPPVVFLSRTKSKRIKGIQCSQHGDKGSSGSRGTLAGMEKAHGDCVVGHYHTGEILRGAWAVGTTTRLDVDYMKDSPSAWMNTMIAIYADGTRQFFPVINKKYRG